MENQEPIITLHDVSVVYNPGKTNEKRALDAISLTIYPGEYIVFFGPSGCGKSTLLYTIAGLESPAEGVVEVSGKNLRQISLKERIEFYRTTIGMVFQAFYLVPQLSARDNMILPLLFANHQPRQREARAEVLMDRFGITEFATRRPSMMSGGQQQRTAIGRALMANPAIVLADEPVGNLDSSNAKSVLELLAQIHRDEKKTVIMVTHNPRDTEYADRVVFLRDGKIERIVENNNKKDHQDVAEINLLAQEFPHASELELQAKAFLRNLLIPFSVDAEKNIEKVLVRYLEGDAQFEDVVSILDDGTEGGGYYKQRAEELAGRIKDMALEARAASQKGDRLSALDRADTIRKHVLDHLPSRHAPLTHAQVVAFDMALGSYLAGDIDAAALHALLRAPLARDGVNLRARTARHIVREIQAISLKG